jgi:MFS family permease
MSIVVILELILVPILIAYVLSYFSDRKQSSWWVMSMAFMSWTLAFLSIFLIPVDLSSTIYRSCLQESGADCKKPFSYVEEEFLILLWKAIYWVAYVLTWLLIPLTISYVNSGEFGVIRKLKVAIKDNLLMYTIIIVLLGVFSVYIITTRHFNNQEFMAYMMALANAYGLFLVILFLGYGLVDIPRRYWHLANRQETLQRLEYLASRLHDELDFALLEYEEILDVRKV